MNHLSTNLKKMRMHHGMTQAEAAERLGVQRSRYSGWENGMSEPNLDMLLACCTLVKMSVGIMLTKDLAPLTKEDINRLLKP
jgi:transcriptional regulator with XRE-family HTH domain